MRRKRVLLLACSTILLCCCLIVGGTYALYTDSATVSNHLRAGTMEVTLERLSYTHHMLDDEGFLVTENTVDSPAKDFSGRTGENLFALGATEVFVPGSYVRSNLRLTNDGDVAFDYSVQVKYTGGLDGSDLADVDDVLAKQIRVRIYDMKKNETTGLYEDNAKIADVLLSELKDGFVPANTLGGYLVAEENSEKYFAVEIYFVDIHGGDASAALQDHVATDGEHQNNQAQTMQAKFDLVISAVQKTTKPQ